MKKIMFTTYVALALVVPFTLYAETVPEQLQSLQTELTQFVNDGTTSLIPRGFSRDGIFGCTGASYGAVGMQGPGGAHVPTFDDASHDQVRLLTYKECLLDGIMNANRGTLVSTLVRNVSRWANEGFDGGSVYPASIPLHILETTIDPEAESVITGAETDRLASQFRREVRVALAKRHVNRTRTPEKILECDLSAEQLDALANNDFHGAGGWSAFNTFALDEGCNALFSYYNARNLIDDATNAETKRELLELEYGSGVRSATQDETIDLGGGQSRTVRRIVTPGFMIAEHLKQTIGTGFRQAENADEIDEILSALLTNIGTEILTDVRGFSGITQSFNGQKSYLDRLVEDSATRARGNLVGAAASIMENTIRVEQEYRQARESSVSTLVQARRQLEAWERTCWSEISSAARAGISAQVESSACQAQGSTSTSCGIGVSVSEEVERGVLGIRIPTPGSITVQGRTTQNGSLIDVTASDGEDEIGPIQPSVLTDGNWLTETIDLTTLADGNISVEALETLSGGTGTAPALTARIEKTTTITGVELTVPANYPAVTFTATANASQTSGQTFSTSATIATSTARSRAVINSNITPILDLVRENIVRSAKALEVLEQIRSALAATASASGQRYILERLDELVAARVLHTEANLRQARDQAIEIENAIAQLLEETRESWEAGWCDPERWQQHTR